jgi:arylsulfatase A-like enzyme
MKCRFAYLRCRAALAAVVALAVLTSSCDRAPPGGRNVLLITLDTTRPDRLGAYGRPDCRTPLLDRLARQGALVETAVADVPVTLPSHTTLMTGIPALGHGVRYNADFKVAEKARTLAEEFSRRGYDTGAVISALVLDAKFGIAQGFRFFEDDLTPGYVKHDESLYPRETHWLPKADRRAEEAVDRALTWMGDSAGSPFFFWLHLYDPHFPFDPPPPWGRMTADKYVAEIQYTDRHLRRVVEWLEDRGVLDETVILVTGDHGEGLDQHREDGHGIFLYDDTVRVPLIVRAPGSVPPSTVVGDQVRTIDVAPTLLALGGHAGSGLGIGENLEPLLAGTGASPDRRAYCESIKTKLFYSGTGLKAVRTTETKLIWAPRPELYDLRRDPGELVNLFEEDGERARRMLETLRDLVDETLDLGVTAVEAANPDAETLEALRSLGYLGGGDGSIRPGSREQELALVGYDPKDLVDVAMGAREIQNGFYDRGEQKLLRFFRTSADPEGNPQLSRLWAAAHQNYAKIWMVRGEYDRAAEEYLRAQRVFPEYDLARWSRIYALNLAGSSDQAKREADEILERYPRSWRVMLHRGLALALMGRTEGARNDFETILREADPEGTPSRAARRFLDQIGTPDEDAALRAYLTAEERRKPGTNRMGGLGGSHREND